jgi:hypothetical protein
MYNFYNAMNPFFVSIYMSLTVMLGSFFLLNLMLAAIWTSFTKVMEEDEESNLPAVTTEEEDIDQAKLNSGRRSDNSSM